MTLGDSDTKQIAPRSNSSFKRIVKERTRVEPVGSITQSEEINRSRSIADIKGQARLNAINCHLPN